MGSEYVYKIWDTEREKYWKSRHGKQQWSQPHHAALAWNNKRHSPAYFPTGLPTTVFAGQRRYVIHKFELVQVEYP